MLVTHHKLKQWLSLLSRGLQTCLIWPSGSGTGFVPGALDSLSSPDDLMVPGSSSPLVPEDFKAYQDLLWHMVASLGIQAEFLQENTQKLLDIL